MSKTTITAVNHFNPTPSAITSIKTDEELDAIFKSVSEGIVTLRDQSEAFGEQVSNNRARTLFLALSMFLKDEEILDHMFMFSNWANEKMAN